MDIKLPPVLEAHLESIEATLERQHYVETGWPCYGVLPAIIERFSGRIKLVHLYRDPIATAASLLTHEVYRRGDWTKAMAILPSDAGVLQPELKEGWKSLSEFEKCLFWWTEINFWAVRVHEEFPKVPWLSLKYEEFFSPKADGVNALMEFLNFPTSEMFLKARLQPVDRYRVRTYKPILPEIANKHSQAIFLASSIGYDLGAYDKKHLKSRYKKNRFKSVLRKSAKLLRRQSSLSY